MGCRDLGRRGKELYLLVLLGENQQIWGPVGIQVRHLD